jgi:hypothetical protein
MKKVIEMLRALKGAKIHGNRPGRAVISGYGPRILKRAKKCTLVRFAVVQDYDRLNRPHAYIHASVVCPPPHGTGKAHVVEARLYPPLANQESPTWTSCDCGNFRYTWEIALKNVHSGSQRCSNGKQPSIRNPGKYPGLCKHVVRMLTTAVRARDVQKVIFEIPPDEWKKAKRKMSQRGIKAKLPPKGFCSSGAKGKKKKRPARKKRTRPTVK